jgi:hypothetical protein
VVPVFVTKHLPPIGSDVKGCAGESHTKSRCSRTVAVAIFEEPPYQFLLFFSFALFFVITAARRKKKGEGQ